jgi:hypothetical protein
VEKMLRTIGLRPEWTTSGKEAVFNPQFPVYGLEASFIFAT